MRRQRNMPQMKQQERTPENKLNEMEVSNLPKTEFKIMVMRMFNELMGRTDENENLNNIRKRHRNHTKEPDRNEENNN